MAASLRSRSRSDIHPEMVSTSLGAAQSLEGRPRRSCVNPGLAIGTTCFEADQLANLEEAIANDPLRLFHLNNDANMVAYLIAGKNSRTVKVFGAIGRGAWVLHPEWVFESIREGCYQDEERYELVDWFPGCRISRQRGSPLKKCRLFIDQQEAPAGIPQAMLLDNIGFIAEQATTVTNPKRCNVCISNTINVSGLRPGVNCVTNAWMLDSLELGILLPQEDYLVDNPEVGEEIPMQPGTSQGSEKNANGIQQSDDDCDENLECGVKLAEVCSSSPELPALGKRNRSEPFLSDGEPRFKAPSAGLTLDVAPAHKKSGVADAHVKQNLVPVHSDTVPGVQVRYYKDQGIHVEASVALPPTSSCRSVRPFGASPSILYLEITNEQGRVIPVRVDLLYNAEFEMRSRDEDGTARYIFNIL